MPIKLDLVTVVIALAIGYFLYTNLRFLDRGRWFRRQSNEQKDALIDADQDWHELHGRDLPIFQIIMLSAVAVITVIGAIAIKSGWLSAK